MDAEKSSGQTASSRVLLADVMQRADQADRAAIARMSPSERFSLALDLSEFAAEIANAVKQP